MSAGPTNTGNDLEMPYGKIAAWGMGLSAVATVAFFALAPCSPFVVAQELIEEGKVSVRHVDVPWVGRVPVALEWRPDPLEARLQAAGALRHALDGLEDEWRVVLPHLRRELRWVEPQLRRELREEFGPEVRDELREELRRELRRELDLRWEAGGLRVLAPSIRVPAGRL